MLCSNGTVVEIWDMGAELLHGHVACGCVPQNASGDALTTRRSDLCVQSQRYCLQLLKRRKQVPLW